MNDLSWIYISNQATEGTQANGWRRNHTSEERLPAVASLRQSWDAKAFSGQRVGVLLEDDMLYPMRITLDQTPPRKERHHFLLWKLKRHLPYPIEQVTLRYLPLQQPNTYLTFSLPTPWLEDLDRMFREQGVHCGHVGGLFSTLLEEGKSFRGTTAICFFKDFYLLAQQNSRGGYERFNVRRLPFDAAHRLDFETLLAQDLFPACAANGAGTVIQLYNFDPDFDDVFRDISRQLMAQFPSVRMMAAQGSSLKRFQELLKKGVPA